MHRGRANGDDIQPARRRWWWRAALIALIATPVATAHAGSTPPAPPTTTLGPTTTVAPTTTTTPPTTTLAPTTTVTTTTPPTTAPPTTAAPVTAPPTTAVASTAPTTTTAAVEQTTTSLPTLDPDDTDSPTPLPDTPEVRAIVFPVVGPFSLGLGFNECAVECPRFHKGSDVLATKLQPVVSPVDGEIVRLLGDPEAGIGVVVRDAEGYEYHLSHFNNDAPSTDDGSEPPGWGLAPGIQRDTKVSAGQLIGFVGDSGNAESGEGQLHLEIQRPDGVLVNPKPSLTEARHDGLRCAPESAVTGEWLHVAGIAVSQSGFRPDDGTGCVVEAVPTSTTTSPPAAPTSNGIVALAVTVASAPRTPVASVTPAAGTGSGRVRLTWVAPSTNGGAAITDYYIQRSTSATTGWTTLSDGVSTATAYTVSGMPNGTRFYFRITARNSIGIGPWSPTVSAIPRNTPSAPRTATATVSATTATVRFLASISNGGAAITGYTATCISSNGGTTRTGTRAAAPVTVASLTPARTYTCSVRATNAAGNSNPSAPTAPFAVPIIPPSAPRTPVASVSPAAGTGSGNVRLTWIAPASNGGSAITDYNIQRSTSATTGWTTLSDGVSTATAYTVTGLPNGTRFYFRIIARNGVGTGSWSPTVNAIPRTVPSAPRTPTATALATTAMVSFVGPLSNGGAAITGYAATCISSNGGTTRTGTGTASPISVANLTAARTYTCTVRATNAAGTGTPSTSTAPFTTTAPTATAFTESFSAPGAPGGNRNGGLDGTRFSVSRWRNEQSPDGTQHVTEGPIPPSDVRVEGGRVVLDVGSQNYGDTIVRINQPFDIAGRTGTVTFDAVLDRPDNSQNGLWGWPEFMFLSEPYSVPSYRDDNAAGPTPNAGIVLHFPWDCGAPKLRTYQGGAETDDFSAWHFGNCTGLPTTAPGVLNRVRLRISQSALEVCVSNAGQTTFQHCWNFAVNLGFTRGFLYFGGHNHATVKYGGGPVSTSIFDNITFDGPVVPTARVSQVPDGSGRDIGYGLPQQGSSPRTFTLQNVNLTNATSARLVLSFRADQISNGNYASWRLNYAFNGGPVHGVAVPQAGNGFAGNLFSIPVDLAELRAGNNTLTLTGTGFYAGYQPYVGNIDLVVR